MENFNYNLIIKNNGNEIAIKTNDVSYAIREFLRADEASCEVCVCNGYTGEVLCHNGDEPYCTDEMALMILGHLCAEHWGEEADEEENEPVCQMCGGDINENGVCQWCGVVYGAEPATETVTAESLVLSLVNELAENCSAIKSKVCGLPS